MSKQLLIDAAHAEETRVAVVEDNQLIDFDIENNAKKTLKGNIYLGKIVRVEPSLQAAFIDYGGNRHGFLAFTEIHPDYFRIPVGDREQLDQPIDENVKKLSDSVDGLDDDTDEEISDFNEDEIPEIDNDDDANEVDADDVVKKKETKETNPYKLYKIQEVIKSRQVVLIQVVKEERGNKGAALTSFISLAGRYCVLMPNAQHSGGISRRITDSGDRRRLKSIISDLSLSEGSSLIVRTAGLDRSKPEIKRDHAYLTKLWQEICAETVTSTAPCLVYEEADLIRRTIRDGYSKEIDAVYVEGEEGYKNAKKYMKAMVPSHAKKVQPYKDDKCPLFFKYKVEQQIEQMYSPTVKLKSGGYIVINQTEALVAIDVNSGRATRERHIETTALNTNMEAAEEVARQIRLRDYAGLIVIDFIDMSDSKNNQLVERKLRESLVVDRARVQSGRISQFGLLEMSRQRLRPSIMESSTIKCDNCGGSGVVRSVASIGLQLLRVIEETCLSKKCGRLITIHMPSNVAFYLLATKRHELSDLEQRFQLKLDLKEDNRLVNTGFKIENENGAFVADGHGNTSASDQQQKDQGNRNKKKDIKPNPQNANSSGNRNKKPVHQHKKEPVHQNKKEPEAATSVNSAEEPKKENLPKQNRRNNYRQNRRNRKQNNSSAPQNLEQNNSQRNTDGGENTPTPKENVGNSAPKEKTGRPSNPKENNRKPSAPKESGDRPAIPKENSGSNSDTNRNTQGEKKPAAVERKPSSNRKGWWQKLLD